MKTVNFLGRGAHAARPVSPESGQALLETVMTTGFLVSIAIVINKLLGPVVLDAFEKIAEALSSVGP